MNANIHRMYKKLFKKLNLFLNQNDKQNLKCTNYLKLLA